MQVLYRRQCHLLQEDTRFLLHLKCGKFGRRCFDAATIMAYFGREHPVERCVQLAELALKALNDQSSSNNPNEEEQTTLGILRALLATLQAKRRMMEVKEALKA